MFAAVVVSLYLARKDARIALKVSAGVRILVSVGIGTYSSGALALRISDFLLFTGPKKQ